MADIITAENLPLVVGAVLSGLAGLAVWKQGGSLGERARAERPPTPEVDACSADMIEALQDIAAAVREATMEMRECRESRMAALLGRMQSQIDSIEAMRAEDEGR